MDIPQPNKQWRKEVKNFWNQIHAEYTFQRGELEMLTICCDTYQRFLDARDELNKNGLMLTSKTGEIKHNPCWSVERYARESFLRYMKALGISEVEKRRPGRPSARAGL
jgi:P27 family predicted phage terminase small subunit